MLDRDQALLVKIQSFFNCGYITFNQSRNSCIYTVSKINDVLNHILPHFANFPRKIFRLFRFF